ncbi:MAG: hypothetical protein IJT65_04610 [Eubacterium sp.]|nr:hypothetical protein [Eubacterium sp.]
MKKRLRIIPILLIIAAFLCSPFFAFAFTEEGEAEVPLLQEGDYEILDAPVISHLGKYGETAEQYLYAELLSHSSDINMARFSISCDDVSAFYSDVINDHPDLFFVSSTVKYNYYPSTNCVSHIFPFYVYDEQETETALEEFQRGTQRALEEVNADMSDEQKAMVLHDYICTEGIYPTVKNEDDEDYTPELADREIYHSAYGFFHNKVVVCAGFTLTYSYLLSMVGIDSTYVASDTMHHAWNKIKIGGNWYNCDLTFDNFDTGTDINNYGSVRHAYFMKSDSYFEGDDGAYHFGGITYDDCDSTSDAYDIAFWNDVNSRIYSFGGCYYYLDSTSTYYSAKLVKRELNGDETQLGSLFNTSRLRYRGYRYDEQDNPHEYSFYDTLIRLAFLDNRFYVYNAQKIYSVLFDGTVYDITTVNEYTGGFGVNEDNNLVYQYYNDDTVRVLDKAVFFENNITDTGGGYNNYPDINLDGFVNAKDYAYILKQGG